MKLREGNVSSRVCPSVSDFVHSGVGVSCDHYKWCIGPHCTVPYVQGPSPLLVISRGQNWRPVQTCSLKDPPPSLLVLTPGGWSTQHIWWASGWYAFCWNALLLPPANEVWGKVIFLHLSVILFTGGVLPQCMLVYPTPSSRPPPHPWSRHPLRSRHIPRADTLPRAGIPLCSACWEIQSTSGRYASYWNAILLELRLHIFKKVQANLENFLPNQQLKRALGAPERNDGFWTLRMLTCWFIADLNSSINLIKHGLHYKLTLQIYIIQHKVDLLKKWLIVISIKAR